MLYRVEGIVLRSIEYGEGNAIVTLLTGEYGKVGLMIRGAKKARSKHSAASQPYTYGEYTYYKSAGSAGTLGTLNHADLFDAFPGIRSDVRRSAHAAYIAELADRLLPDGEASSALFELVKGSFEALSAGKDPPIVGAIAELRLFHFAGVAPVTDRCAECGRTPEAGEEAFWSPQAGGLLCSRCRVRERDAVMLAPGARKLLPVLQRTDPRRLGAVRVGQPTRVAIRGALSAWFDRHVDVKLRSKAVLEQVEAVFGDGPDGGHSDEKSC